MSIQRLKYNVQDKIQDPEKKAAAVTPYRTNQVITRRSMYVFWFIKTSSTVDDFAFSGLIIKMVMLAALYSIVELSHHQKLQIFLISRPPDRPTTTTAHQLYQTDAQLQHSLHLEAVSPKLSTTENLMSDPLSYLKRVELYLYNICQNCIMYILWL